MLKLYNTLSRKKEVFKPISGKVGIYSCGPIRKIYKVLSVVGVSGLCIVSMLPGDRNGLPDALFFGRVFDG